MKELSNRTATFTDSVIRRMTRISNKYDAVNLSQGFPDFDPPAQLLNSLSTIAADPKPLYHQYSITWGSQAMREALAAKQEHFMGMPIDPNCITDEVYEHIVYAPHEHVYMATLPGMFERTISCSSLSKTYSITGWRLGYTIAPAQITERIKKVHDFLTVGAAAPLQEAVVAALNFDGSYYDEVLDLYTAKRDLFCQGLDSIGLKHNVPQGAYYVMMDISEFGYDSDLEFCEDLASKVGVGAVPGSSFFREPVNHLIRFHFAKRDETLNAALENLKSLRDKIKPRG